MGSITDTTATTNGHSSSSPPTRPLKPGFYVPTPTFFSPDTEALDLPTLQSHILRLCSAGVAGLVLQGSNGEAVHLTASERNLITRTCRTTLTSNNYSHIPLIIGCGAPSTLETIQLCKDAAAAGGDYVLILPPGYYGGLYTLEKEGGRDGVLKKFFEDVAAESPLPVLVYNYPGAVIGAVDLSSDFLIGLKKGKMGNRFVGVKFTCGNTGKLGRVAAEFSGEKEGKGGEYLCFSGSGDFLLPSLIAGSAGCIGGIGNIAPKVCVRIQQLWDAGKIAEARKLQEVLARGDWAAIQTGVVGTKVALREFFGYGGFGRRPLPRMESGVSEGSKGEDERWRGVVEGFRELVEVEKAL